MRRRLAWSLGPLAVGLALGGLVVVVELQGAGDLPAPAGAAVVLAGIAAGLAPLRYGLPVAMVLAAHEGFLTDFVGGHSTLWEEGFTVALVLRAAAYRFPSRAELAAGALVALGFALYAITGTDLDAVGLGLKLLVLFALAGWAVARLDPGREEWWALYQGLAVAVAASVVVAVWQRLYGPDALVDLGLRYGESIRQAGEELRAYAGFLHAAPFAYTMAAAALCWLALALSGDRRRALWTVWMPILAVAGMTLSLSRTSFVAASAAAVVVVLARRGGGAGLLVPMAAGVLAIVLVASPSSISFLGSGFTGGTESASQRRDIWSERASHLSLFGAGPASVGSGVLKLHPSREGNPDDDRKATLLRRGVVDNQYLAWLYQYGWFGGLLICLAWIGLLGWVVLARVSVDAEGIAGQLAAGFAAIAGVSVNIWEEFPINLVTALVVGLALGSGTLSRRRSDIRPA